MLEVIERVQGACAGVLGHHCSQAGRGLVALARERGRIAQGRLVKVNVFQEYVLDVALDGSTEKPAVRALHRCY